MGGKSVPNQVIVKEEDLAGQEDAQEHSVTVSLAWSLEDIYLWHTILLLVPGEQMLNWLTSTEGRTWLSPNQAGSSRGWREGHVGIDAALLSRGYRCCPPVAHLPDTPLSPSSGT